MHARWLRFLGLVLLSTVATPTVVSGQGPADVLIRIANKQVDTVEPYVKGLCKTPVQVKGGCAANVVWRVAGLPQNCSVVISQKTNPPQFQCFQATSWTINSNGGTADSGATGCLPGQIWRYDVTLKCPGEADQVIDPVLVIDY